jgi:hypothetical protein
MKVDGVLIDPIKIQPQQLVPERPADHWRRDRSDVASGGLGDVGLPPHTVPAHQGPHQEFLGVLIDDDEPRVDEFRESETDIINGRLCRSA